MGCAILAFQSLQFFLCFLPISGHREAKWFGPNWSRVFCVLYADSTLLWYETQMSPRPQGSVYLKVAPELIATGQVARRLFHVPNPPSCAQSAYEHVIAIGERRRQRVHFFLADSQHELRYVPRTEDPTRFHPARRCAPLLSNSTLC